MPQVPYQPLTTVAPNQPLDYQRVQANPDAFGADIGRATKEGSIVGRSMEEAASRVSGATQQLGAQVMSSSDQLFRAAEAFQRKQDETNVDAVYSQQFSPAFRSMYQQYYSTQGKNAVDQMPVAIASMQRLQEDTTASLPNDRQKHLFNSVSRRRVEMELDGMARYADTQNKVYQTEVFNSTLDNMALDGADKHNDEAAWGSAIGSMAYTIDKFAADNGKSAEWARDKLNERTSSAAVQRVQRMMVDAPEAAQAWYAQHQSLISDKQRPLLEHQIKAAVLPNQIKREAQDVMVAVVGPDWDRQVQETVSNGAPYPAAGPQRVTFGPSVRGSEAGADGVVRITVPNDAEAKRAAKELGSTPFSITVDAATPTSSSGLPTHPRDTRAMLGSLVAEAERRYPNDPVKRDALITQIKGNISTIAAIQTGVQNQSHSTLTSLMMPKEGPKPTTVEELTATPQGQQAWGLVSPESQRGFLAWLDKNQRETEGKAAKSNAAVNEEVMRRINLPPTDPSKITEPGQLIPFFSHGLTRADFEWHTKLIDEQRTPDGQRLSDVRKNFFTAIKPRFDSSTLMVRDEKGGEDNFRFQQYVTEKERKYRAEGKDPYSLYNPASKDYVGNDVPAFQRSLQQKVQDRVESVAGRPALRPGEVSGGVSGAVTYKGFRFPNQKALDAYKAAGG